MIEIKAASMVFLVCLLFNLRTHNLQTCAPCILYYSISLHWRQTVQPQNENKRELAISSWRQLYCSNSFCHQDQLSLINQKQNVCEGICHSNQLNINIAQSQTAKLKDKKVNVRHFGKGRYSDFVLPPTLDRFNRKLKRYSTREVKKTSIASIGDLP